MSHKSVLIGIVVVILIGAGCATTTPYNPFKISQEEFNLRTKTIALAPVYIPEGLEEPDPVKIKFESLIESRLREAGFLVIPSREYAEIWKRMTDLVGGYFDPTTGKRDETKFKTVQDYTLRELNTKFNMDSLLYPSILVFNVNWSGSTVYWHGTSEPIKSLGEQFLEGLIGISYHGTIPACSLVVAIKDIHGRDLYINYGGIQLLAKTSGNKFVEVPRHQLFSNEERNLKAVSLTLEPLIKKPDSAEKPK